MPSQKSFLTTYVDAGLTTFTAPADVAADAFSSSTDPIAVDCVVIDGKKITYNVTLSGGVYNATTQSMQELSITIANANGKVKNFDNLDQVTAMAKNVLGTAAVITMNVTGLDKVRGGLTLSGDPAASAARALARMSDKKANATLENAKLAQGLIDIAYYAQGNSLEQAYYAKKQAESQTVNRYMWWTQNEYTRLGGQ